MSAIDNILNFKKDEEDFYAILGCDENSTVSLINHFTLKTYPRISFSHFPFNFLNFSFPRKNSFQSIYNFIISA